MEEYSLKLDYYSLLNLHKALLEAKFNTMPDNKLISGSPLIASTYIQIRNLLIEGKKGGEWKVWFQLSNRPDRRRQDHIIYEDNQMLPCCGHFYVPDAKLENVTISGCGNGIDWTVRHSGKNVILTLENGTEETIPLEEYRQKVYRFVDKIEEYYKSCSPKKIPEDSFRRDGYVAFWNEWHRRRNA